MTLTLKIDPQLEQRLREQAARQGLKPDSYAVAAIEEQLRRDGQTAPHLSRDESQLLQQINIGFSNETWDRYDDLVARREDETLTSEEFEELKALTNQIEEQNVHRIQALIELARVRNTTFEALMDELQIRPRQRQGS
jgi:hypothetical protein